MVLNFHTRVLKQVIKECEPHEVECITDDFDEDSSHNRYTVETIPIPVLKKILALGGIPGHDATQYVQNYVKGASTVDDKDFWDDEIKSFSDLHTKLVSFEHSSRRPRVEIRMGQRWYPCMADANIHDGFMGRFLTCEFFVMVGEHKYSEHLFVGESEFDKKGLKKEKGNDESPGNKIKKGSLRAMLQKIKVRQRETDLDEYQAAIVKANEVADNTGKVMNAIAGGLNFKRILWFITPEAIELGTKAHPQRVVIEKNFEVKDEELRMGGGECNRSFQSPFIRVFSLTTKEYVFVDSRDLEEATFDKTVIDRLILPTGMHELVTKLFKADNGELFGDMMSSRHGGMIILANGGPGVGKTLTAEAFAEYSGRPLYSVETAELGTNLDKIEAALQLVLARAARWNAVLLLDEADIFLAKRGLDLERSAIVGVFLRLLDYHKGLLFMTSNRADVIDPAFASRITVRLDYPALDQTTREKVWHTMLKCAHISTPAHLGDVLEVPLNGRQIRNTVRLAKVLHGEKVTVEQLKDLCKYSPMAEPKW